MLSRVELTNAHTVRGRPTLKNNTECFRNMLVRKSKNNKGNFQDIQRLMDLIEAMKNMNVKSVHVISIRV